MRYQSLVPSRLTSFHTQELSSTTPLVPPGGAVLDREGSNEFLVSGKAPWQLLFPQFHNLGSFPVTTLQESKRESRPMPALQLQLGTATKNGVERISSSTRRSKIAAAYIAGVRGKEQGTRYLALMGETYRPYSGCAERET
jgi:hypothetical protein